MDKKDAKPTAKNVTNSRNYVKSSHRTNGISQMLPKGAGSPVSASVAISIDVYNDLLELIK